MDTDNEQGADQAIESFAGLVAYVWAINECIGEGAFGNIGSYAQELSCCAKRTAADLGVGELDAMLMGLSFFKEYADNTDLRIMSYTETIALATAIL